MILGDLLQQCYNIARHADQSAGFLGADALAAVGSAFTLMTFLTSILLGLSLGQRRGVLHPLWAEDFARLREGVRASFALLAAVDGRFCARWYTALRNRSSIS